MYSIEFSQSEYITVYSMVMMMILFMSGYNGSNKYRSWYTTATCAYLVIIVTLLVFVRIINQVRDSFWLQLSLRYCAGLTSIVLVADIGYSLGFCHYFSNIVVYVVSVHCNDLIQVWRIFTGFTWFHCKYVFSILQNSFNSKWRQILLDDVFMFLHSFA